MQTEFTAEIITHDNDAWRSKRPKLNCRVNAYVRSVDQMSFVARQSWKSNFDLGSLAEFAFNNNCSTMTIDDLVRDVKPKSIAEVSLGTVKGLEEIGSVSSLIPWPLSRIVSSTASEKAPRERLQP